MNLIFKILSFFGRNITIHNSILKPTICPRQQASSSLVLAIGTDLTVFAQHYGHFSQDDHCSNGRAGQRGSRCGCNRPRRIHKLCKELIFKGNDQFLSENVLPVVMQVAKGCRNVKAGSSSKLPDKMIPSFLDISGDANIFGALFLRVELGFSPGFS